MSKSSKQKWNCWFCKKNQHFDNKLKNVNKKVTSNKTKHIEVKTKLDDLEKKKLN